VANKYLSVMFFGASYVGYYCSSSRALLSKLVFVSCRGFWCWCAI